MVYAKDGMMIYPVILSGGSGTRLWPLSRMTYPKQFINLISDKSMIQETVLRLNDLNDISSPIIVCNNDSRFIVAHQMTQINKEDCQIILEPEPKSTLPPITAIANKLYNENPDAIMLVLPSDHCIKDIAAFHKVINIGKSVVKQGKIVTFGIVPDRPEIGYGYIHFNKNSGNSDFYGIESFKEKPDLQTAEKYLQQGNFLWNSGMFLFKASTLLDEVYKFHPDIYENAGNSIKNSKKDLCFIKLDASDFSKCSSISIDYGIMEKTESGVVIPMDAQWSDVGTWDSLWSQLQKDENGNSTKGDIILENTKDSYVYSNYSLVATVGIENLIVVNTEDSVLVADKSKLNDLSKVIQKLKQANRNELKDNKTEYKPWGSNHHIENCKDYKINHLLINSGEHISIHYHLNYSEHWIVLSGQATVLINDEERLLSKGESIYIPANMIHSVENKQKEPLHILEIQTGDNLDLKDIKKIKDFYR